MLKKRIKERIKIKNINPILKRLISFILLIIISISVYSNNYYLNSTIQVFKDGSVSINSNSNLNYFKNISHSQKYTYKKQEYWILNISTKEKIKEYKFKLILPKEIEINYIKTTPNIKFQNENNHITIMGEGYNEPLKIIIQYKFKNNIINNINNSSSNKDLILLISSIFILISIIGLLYIFRYNKKNKYKKKNNKNLKNNKKISKETNKEKDGEISKKRIENKENEKNILKNESKEIKIKDLQKINFEILPIRQQEIIKILLNNNKITQKKVELIMKIPKSSISRNIKTLEIKEIIRKERIGNTNYLFLNEEIFEDK